MSLHLIKLSVGTESVEGLELWQARRLRLTGRLFHQTRMSPRRHEELLDGGSIYWVIRGQIQARQQLMGIERQLDEEGRSTTLLMLDSLLVRTVQRRHRAFQGWRYFAGEDVPADWDAALAENDELPSELLAELQDLGLM